MEFGYGWAEFDMLKRQAVVDGLAVPAELFVTLPSDKSSPSLELDLVVVNGRPRCNELRIIAKDGGRGVEPLDLRSIRLSEWIDDLFAAIAGQVSPGPTAGDYVIRPADFDGAAKALRKARRGTRRTITDDQLADVAATYQANPKAPTQAVADYFAVAHRTASNAVKRAEEKVLLAPTTRGKARQPQPPANPPRAENRRRSQGTG